MGKQLALVLFVSVLGARSASADKKFAGGKGASWSCKKDPTVYINHGKGKYTFTGPCTSIFVNGGKNTLKIEAVDSLSINGAANKVDVGTVGSIKVSGTDNTITWKKAKSGDQPTIDSDTPAKTAITQKK